MVLGMLLGDSSMTEYSSKNRIAIAKWLALAQPRLISLLLRE